MEPTSAILKRFESPDETRVLVKASSGFSAQPYFTRLEHGSDQVLEQ